MFLNDGKHSPARRMTMTPTLNTPRVAEAAPLAAAEQVLRDVAYVLRLTRRVKEEMMADRAPATSSAVRKAEGALVA
jgi:hypothetical protein